MDLFEVVKAKARRALLNPAEPCLSRGTTDSEIDAFGLRTSLTVPLLFREWLKFTNGSDIGAGGTHGIRTSHPVDDIEYHYTHWPEWRERGWIPVGGDGCGNYYVAATHDEDGPGNPVFFIDCHDDPNHPAYVVATDVLHFLDFYLGRELGEQGWPFNREFVLGKNPNLGRYTTIPKGWELDEGSD